MSLLDMQGMEAEDGARHADGGRSVLSTLSTSVVADCRASSLSILVAACQ